MSEFSDYVRLRDAGSSPREVYLTGKAAGLDRITLLRLLRTVFSLSLPEAKEVTVLAEGRAASLEDYQEQILPAVEEALEHGKDSRTRPRMEMCHRQRTRSGR